MSYSFRRPDSRRVNSNNFYTNFNNGSLDSIVGGHFLGSLPSFLSDDVFSSKVSNVFPKFNVIKNENYVLLEAAVPGYKREDIKVEIKDQKLIVSSKQKTSEDKPLEYLLKEFSSSDFSRTILLPENLDLSTVSATIDSGILSVRLSIKQPVKSTGNVINVDIL